MAAKRQTKLRCSAASSRPKIGLLFESTNFYARELLRGVGEYALGHTDWHLQISEIGAREAPPTWLQKWDGAGLIVRGENQKVAECVSRLRVPVVDLTPSRLIPKAPWVKADDVAISAMAAAHFLERGFKNFAYCGIAGFRWSQKRGEAFVKILGEANQFCFSFSPKAAGTFSDTQTEAIAQWVAELPKPVAIFTCMDSRARQVVEACQMAGISVPEQVAILGTDNDDLLCGLSPVPISSVILNPKKAGWEAALCLSRMLAGNERGVSELFIPPVGIATRQSTDILAVNDPRIAQALRFIRENATKGIGVKQVLEVCPMSRRNLEQRFRTLLGRTPHDEIIRVQLERAKELLVATSLQVGEVADRVSLEGAYFSAVFRGQTGLSPRNFRKRFGLVL